ncbi:hypothetical protein B0I35DRAFT_443540 [Stachybotrys elegans]|uniref:Uncharacterized protein n=1 Tax=Stachybotrys elegans TaxID=80388 RepID=A0A8K0SK09_9HYPO|nr:hypothetical protein B0I35DRAFT_443540 [Stachybotrys elegans]
MLLLLVPPPHFAIAIVGSPCLASHLATLPELTIRIRSPKTHSGPVATESGHRTFAVLARIHPAEPSVLLLGHRHVPQSYVSTYYGGNWTGYTGSPGLLCA